MKREDLKNIGIEDSKIDKIMKLHGQSVNKLKEDYSDYDELKAERDNLQSQIDKSNKDLKELRKSAGDNEELKSKIKSLQDENKSLESKHAEEMQSMKLNSAIDAKLTEAKARNIKPLKAMLDMDKIKFNDDGTLTGLDDQVAGLQKSDAYLFDNGKRTNYEPNGDDGNSGNDVEVMKGIFTGKTTEE
ncbi:phage scaffolding protein [Apilactobacillus xinyiensis]|uniref:phage scaffolding protein n=1 Tax=Apilactobacillus xinyiensis TaxID=2841032 RepID=UPI00200C7698|nr:phage scaffolding protein [Apilactobacillus xinyiensis]MCL0330605.1 phage scaffolding protein [Apilactobacillus xinyiensis]